MRCEKMTGALVSLDHVSLGGRVLNCQGILESGQQSADGSWKSDEMLKRLERECEKWLNP